MNINNYWCLSWLIFWFYILNQVSAVTRPFPDDKVEDCTDPELRAGWEDWNGVEVVVQSDYEIFLNGTLRFNHEMKSPWKAFLIGEKLVGGKWIHAQVEKKYKDYCKAFRDPTDFLYFIYKKFQGCPLPAGVSTVKILIKKSI